MKYIIIFVVQSNNFINMKKRITFRLVQGLTVLSGALFLLLVVLKLGGWLAWSWWWVCAPVLIPSALALILVAVVFILLNYIAKKAKDVEL